MKLWFQFVKSIERLCSNKSKEYVDQNLSQYLEENGVSQELKWLMPHNKMKFHSSYLPNICSKILILFLMTHQLPYKSKM